jgi:DNA repair exonuclease SbcCD ATPase subunit
LATFNNPEEQQRRLRELADNLERDFLKWLKEQNLYDWFHKAACGDPDAIASYFDDVSNPNRFNWFEHNSILSARGIDGTQDVVRYREILSELATIGEEIAKVNEIITSLSNVKETIAGLETHETKLRGFLGNCQRKIGEANATIKAFTDLYPTETTTDFEVQLSNWQSAVEAKRVELQTLSDLVGRLTQLLNGVNTLQPQVNQLKKVVEDQEKVIGGQTMDGEFYGMSPNDVSNKLANTRVELDLLETKIVQQEKRLEELKNTVAILENVAPKGNFEAEIATWVGKRDTKISERSEKSKEIAEINSTVVVLQNTISRVETDIPKFSKLREKQRTWKYTADMISGNNSKKISLESFVLNSRLSQIVDAANLFLQQFYPDRFELQASLENATKRSRAGLALVVYDLTKGTERFPETFSGGETFILSLALALGLSQTTQDVIANPLQDLFIDEGFGTLDSETLAYVATALQDLTTTGVSVGIITHVEALQQAVGVGFKLVKNNESKTEVSYL